MVVYPSNATICERLNGMPCSTMRRHLSGLVQAGFLVRRDSPNGKRFVRRSGGAPQAFGFDLTPLVVRFGEVCEAAETARAAQETYDRARQTVSLMRRDLAGLAEYGARVRPELSIWDAYSDLATLTSRDLRRKLALDELTDLEGRLGVALNDIRDRLDTQNTDNMSTNGVEDEQHYQTSKKDLYVSEPRLEKAKGEQGGDKGNGSTKTHPPDNQQRLPNVPLGLVLQCCDEIKTYSVDPIRHWHQLVRTIEIVRPMMGISPTAWQEAVVAMGPEEAAVVVAAMLERFGEIQSPGGYLRHLARKAEEGAFSCGSMVMALMRKSAA